MDILTDVLDRVRLSGTLLFHYELGCPWSLALPRFPDAVFHYLSRGSAIVALEDGRELRMDAGDFVLIARGEPHRLCSPGSGRRVKPFPLLNLDRRPAHVGVISHGGKGKLLSTMICGYFSLPRLARSSVLELLPPILHLRPAADHEWLETILQRLVNESRNPRPGQRGVLSRITEVLFIEVLRSWIKSLGQGEGGWLGAIADPHIGKALQLIHESRERHWTLRELGRRVGLGRSAFSARFTQLVGQPMLSYLVARRVCKGRAIVLGNRAKASLPSADQIGACPLLAQSGRPKTSARLSAFGAQRTYMLARLRPHRS